MKSKLLSISAAIIAFTVSSTIAYAGQMFSYGASFSNCSTTQNSQITPARSLQGLNPSDPGAFLYECTAFATTGGYDPGYEQRHIKIFSSGAGRFGLVYAVFDGADNKTGVLVHRLEFIPNTFHCTVFGNNQSCPDGNGNFITIEGDPDNPLSLVIVSR